MTTLADKFLADFDEDDDEVGNSVGMSAEDAENAEAIEREEQAKMDVVTEEDLKVDNIHQVVKLWRSQELMSLLAEIDQHWDSQKNDFSTDNAGLNIDTEYDLIVRSNEMALRVLEEINKCFRFVRDIYTKKFPELETIVVYPLDYVRIVKRVGNETDLALVDLSGILQQANIITLTLTAANTTGKPLDEEDLKKCMEGCDVCLELEDNRQKILKYVESRMKYYAPNVTAIVGSTIAAQLISIAGGLKRLADMPATNVQVLGNKKANLAGFSSAFAATRAGFIYHTETVQRIPIALRTRACRLIAGKVTLAARIDAFHEARDGAPGRKMREEIEKKVDKWMEPPPPRQEKALPIPDDKPRKHRGGRRARKLKQAYAMTELRKRANRIMFGKPTEEIGNSFDDLGMLGSTEGSGLLRITANYDDKGFKIKPKKLKQEKQTSGLATSIYAFTPFQGLDLPATTNKPKKTEETGYFSTTAGFTSTINKNV